ESGMRQPPILCEASRIASTSAWAVGSARSSRSLPAAARTSPSRTTTAPIGTSSWSAARSASRSAKRMKCSSRPKKGPSKDIAGQVSPSLHWASGRADDEDAAGGVVRNLVRHAAEQEPLGARHALVADHDQVGPGLLGDVQDRVGGISFTRKGLGL